MGRSAGITTRTDAIYATRVVKIANGAGKLPMPKSEGLSSMLRRAIWEVHGKRCKYCRKALRHNEFHIDHLLPRRLEQDEWGRSKIFNELGLGLDFDLRSLRNLVPACADCNIGKRDSVIPVFTALHLHDALRKAPLVEKRRIELMSEEDADVSAEFCPERVEDGLRRAPSVFGTAWWEFKTKFYGDDETDERLQKILFYSWVLPGFATFIIFIHVIVNLFSQPSNLSETYESNLLFYWLYGVFYFFSAAMISFSRFRWKRRKMLRGWE